MSTDVQQLTDEQFHQEIIDLCLGTHWTQGTLNHECLIEITPEVQVPEGAEVMHRLVNYGEQRKPHYIKFKYCLMGMVLKVGDIDGNESAIERDSQAARITAQLWEQIPDESLTKTDKETITDCKAEEDGAQLVLNIHIRDIEAWNDWTGPGDCDCDECKNRVLRAEDADARTRDHVVALVTRARDAAAAAA